jgi:8-oxo-dGTP pyrophosphatase MutT (NUDIX family)
VKERKDSLWTLPGGWVDVGDAPSVAAIREVEEESGYDTSYDLTPYIMFEMS